MMALAIACSSESVGDSVTTKDEKRRVRRSAQPAAIFMAQVELDRAVIEILPLEGVVRRVLVIESGAQLAPADRERALGEQRPEAAAAAPQRADRFVEHVGHAACRRSKGKGRELRGHLAVEGLNDADDGIVRLVGFDWAEVRHVRKPSGRTLQDDLAENELGQHLRQGNVLCPGGCRHHEKTENRRTQ
jgi:hypothetical protein